MRIGLLTSVPVTLDAFFPAWVDTWRAAGHHVAPASGPGPDGEASEIEGARTIAGVTRAPRVTSGTAHRHLRAWARDEDLDVVLVSTATASALARTARLGVPVVYFCHGLHWTGEAGPRSLPVRAVERALLQTTAGVVTLNAVDQRWFVAHRADPVLRLRAGVGLDLEAWPARPSPGRDAGLRLVWVGEQSPRKRPYDALEVVRLLRDLDLDVELVMLGDGPLLGEVRAAAGRLAGVTVVGRADPRPHLADAHALLHTAEWEGLPRVVLEAAAVGRPALGYDVKGVSDAPGALVAGRPGETRGLADLVARWWAGEVETPAVDRASLDWHRAHDAVTGLLGSVLAPPRG